MVVIGILYAYVFGAFINSWQILAVVCAVPTLIFCVLMVFSKESPSYLLSKGKDKEAQEAMQYFRGKEGLGTTKGKRGISGYANE